MTLREPPYGFASPDVLLEPESLPSDPPDLRALLEEVRFELLPLRSLRAAADALPAGAVVTITCSPKAGIEGTLRAAEKIAAKGFRVVPHLAARAIRDEDHLAEVLDACSRLGITDAFVPGGDAKEPAGSYASSLDLLRAMDARGHPFSQVGIAAYPEGHWLIDDAALHEEIRKKQTFATYAVTQMCFSAETLIRYLARLRTEGIQLPVYAGVAGALDRLKLATIGMKIGIGQSLRFLKHQAGGVGNLLGAGHYEPTDLLRDLVTRLESSHRLRGLHVYTFNQAAKTEAWRGALLGSLTP